MKSRRVVATVEDETMGWRRALITRCFHLIGENQAFPGHTDSRVAVTSRFRAVRFAEDSDQLIGREAGAKYRDLLRGEFPFLVGTSSQGASGGHWGTAGGKKKEKKREQDRARNGTKHGKARNRAFEKTTSVNVSCKKRAYRRA